MHISFADSQIKKWGQIKCQFFYKWDKGLIAESDKYTERYNDGKWANLTVRTKKLVSDSKWIGSFVVTN